MTLSPGRSGLARLGILGCAALIAATALGFALTAAEPASADVVSPLEKTYDETHYGDFIHVGNGVLECPPGGSPFSNLPCTDGQDRTDPSVINDRYDMQWHDPDGGGPLYNGSEAELTIPPGSRVSYAQLSWAGSTGVFRDSNGQLHSPDTGDPACGAYQEMAGSPSPIPPGTPQDQELSVSIDGGTASAVPPDDFVSEPPPASGGQYYSAHADVTDLLADAPTGQATTVLVGDVWAPEGYNCFGGWSLTVVYSYPAPESTYAPHLKQIYVYTGHVRQNQADPDTDTVIDGFYYAGGDIQLGMTAYEGDYGITGDYFDVNGTQLTEPQINVDDNFFISATDGSRAPDHLNNFSVDAKALEIQEETGLIPLDATSADLAFGTNGDAYMAQLLVFSVPLPELQLNKEVCDSADAADCEPGGPGPWRKDTALPIGETAHWRITVTNPSGVDITDATLRDDAESSCADAAGTFNLDAGDSTTFYCSTSDIDDSFTNAARTSFIPPGAPPDSDPTVSPPSEATADPYGLRVSKQVCGSAEADDCGAGGDGPWASTGTVRAGETAYWRITVRNIGTAPMTDVELTDHFEPTCATVPDTFDLDGGQTRHFYCATENVTEELSNVAVVAAPAPPTAPADSPGVTDTDEATVRPVGDLATTGNGVLPFIAAGLGLLVAGATALLLLRLHRPAWQLVQRYVGRRATA